MTTEFEEKLRAMSFENPGITRWLKLSDKDIEQVKILVADTVLKVMPERYPPEETPYDENTYEHGVNDTIDKFKAKVYEELGLKIE